MHAIETVLQTIVASDENKKQTIDYLKYQLFTRFQIRSSEGEAPPNHRPDAFPLGAELPPSEFVSLFLNHIRAQAETILAAAQAAWDQEQRKAQEVASRNTGKLPSDVLPTHRQGAQNGQGKVSKDLQATAEQAADSAALLDLDSFPALGSSSVPGAKNNKVRKISSFTPCVQHILQPPLPQPPC